MYTPSSKVLPNYFNLKHTHILLSNFCFWRHIIFLFTRAAEKQNNYLYFWLIPSLFFILKVEI